MKKTILSTVALVIMISCKQPTQETTSDIVPSETTEQTDLISGKYRYENNGDTVRLQIAVSGENAQGDLLISYFEKDRSEGTFSGKIENNILIADRIFQSEGVESQEQIVIKFENGKAYLGYGEVEENEYSVKFKDVNALSYDMDFPLDKE